MKLILFWCFFDSRGCGGVKTGKLNPHSIQLAWSNMKTLEAHAPSKKEPTIFAHQDPLNLLPHPFEEMLRSKGMMRPLCSQKRTVQEHGGFQPSHKALHPRSLPEFKSARAPGSRASPKSPGQIFPRLGGPFLQSFNTKRVTLRIHPDMSSRNCMTCPPRTTGTSEKKKKRYWSRSASSTDSTATTKTKTEIERLVLVLVLGPIGTDLAWRELHGDLKRVAGCGNEGRPVRQRRSSGRVRPSWGEQPPR